MAKAFDTKMKGLADRLLNKFGSKVTVTRQGQLIGSGYGVFVTEDSTLVGSDLMVQTIARSRRMKITAIQKAPEPGDLLKADKEEWKIKSVKRTRPNDLTISYEVEV